MRIPILMYHMVNDQPHPADARYCCRVGAFRRQMEYLQSAGYQVISLSDLISLGSNCSEQEKKMVAITFDDGYLDNFENAFPILVELGFPFTVFVVPECVGGVNAWMSSNGSEPSPLMSWKHIFEIEEMHGTIGSHTSNHVNLTEADYKSAWSEIQMSKTVLEQKLGSSVDHFAYPYGAYSEDHRDMVKQSGYYSASSTRPGFNTHTTDPFALRRLDIYGSDKLWNFKMKLMLGTNDGSFSNVSSYYWSRILSRV